MVESCLALLATTLFFLKCCPKEGWSLPPVRQHRRRRPSRGSVSPTVLMLANRRPTQPGDFGTHYPQFGRFSTQHKTGQRLASTAMSDSVMSTWGSDVTPGTSSTTLNFMYSEVAPRAEEMPSMPDTVKEAEHCLQDIEMVRSVNGVPIGCSRHHDHHHLSKSTNRNRYQSDQSSEDQSGRHCLDKTAHLTQLHAKVSNGMGRLCAWTNPPGDSTRKRARPLLFHEASLLLRHANFDIARSAGTVVRWGRSRGCVAAGAARKARVGVRKWTGRQAALISEIKASTNLGAGGSSSVRGTLGAGGSVLREAFSRVRRGGNGRMRDRSETGGKYHGSRLAYITDQTVQNVIDVVASDEWEHVATTSGVVVYRRFVAVSADGVPVEPGSSPETTDVDEGGFNGGSCSAVQEAMMLTAPAPRAAGTPRQFACVKATAILDVPPDVVYRLFADNSRVNEYNELCREVADLETLSEDSKITWAASGRLGPFKARDFCTLVHFRTLSDGTLAQVSRPVEHPAAPRSSRYVRSEILLAGNFMRPVPGDPSRTEFLMITQVNPGGAAETRAGAMLVNSLCTSSPVNFIRRVEAAAQKLMREVEEVGERSECREERGRPAPVVVAPHPVPLSLTQAPPREDFSCTGAVTLDGVKEESAFEADPLPLVPGTGGIGLPDVVGDEGRESRQDPAPETLATTLASAFAP